MLQFNAIQFGAGTRKIQLHQGKKVLKLEPEMTSVAVGYPNGKRAAVENALKALNPILLSPLDSHQLFQVTLPSAGKALKNAWKTLGEHVKNGVVRFATPALKHDDGSGVAFMQDQLMVRFTQKKPIAQLKAWAKTQGLKFVKKDEFVDTQALFSFVKHGWRDMIKLASKIDKARDVEFANINFLRHINRGV